MAAAADSRYRFTMKHSHHSHHTEFSHHSRHDGHPSAPDSCSDPLVIHAAPSQDEVARKAYEIYLREGCPQGRDVQHWLAAEIQMSV